MNRRNFLEQAGGLGVGIGIDLGAGVLSPAPRTPEPAASKR